MGIGMICLALYQPDIPQNAGSAARLAACLGVALDLIEPCGFDASDRNFKRAGMDYLERAAIMRHASWDAFRDWSAKDGRRLVLATTKAAQPFTDFTFQPDDIILMGRESAGVPYAVHEAVDARVLIPMRAGLRSINVVVAAGIILGEALRQTAQWPIPSSHDVETI